MLSRFCLLILWVGLLDGNWGEGVSGNSLQAEPLNEPVSVKLLYGESHGISWTDLQSQDRLEPLLDSQDLNVFGLDYHYNRRTIYFSSWGNIWSLQLNEASSRRVGEPTVLVEDAASATSVAVDWEKDRVYWASPAESAVWRVDLLGRNRTVIINDTEALFRVNNLVLDPYEGLLFLAVDGGGFLRADLDGHDQWRANIKSEDYISDVTIAIDIMRRRLYISSQQDYLPRLVSCGYDGRDLVEYDLTDKWWDDFVSVGVFRDQLFWAQHQNSDRDSVFKANMSSDGSVTYELEYRTDASEAGTRIWAVKVYHPELQTHSGNVAFSYKPSIRESQTLTNGSQTQHSLSKLFYFFIVLLIFVLVCK